ncbi:MAG: hypothetical protein JXB48_05260 [Candidatus Latescibacteria bacterium]|nr:hypothetical protein [Candidatus Latescibacterota bacterium]
MRLGLVIILCLVCTFALCLAHDINIEKFKENACVQYTTEFTVETTPDMWNRILDNPLLMGKLWELYQFEPHYKVSRRGSNLHIIDPSGIEGDLISLQSGNNLRIFYGNGTMKNWGIPISLMGKALFFLDYTYNRRQMVVTFRVYGEGGDTVVTRLLLKAASPVLRRYIRKRIEHNLRDFKIILTDIMKDPDKIRHKLTGKTLTEFNRLYS